MDNKEKTYKIKESTINAVLQVLSQLSYKQVFQLMNAINNDIVQLNNNTNNSNVNIKKDVKEEPKKEEIKSKELTLDNETINL